MPGGGLGTQVVGSWAVAVERGWKGALEGTGTGGSWLGGLQRRQKGKFGEQENSVMFHEDKKGMTKGRAR